MLEEYLVLTAEMEASIRRRQRRLWIYVLPNLILSVSALIFTPSAVKNMVTDTSVYFMSSLASVPLSLFFGMSFLYGKLYKRELRRQEGVMLEFQGRLGKRVKLDLSGDPKRLADAIEKLALQEAVERRYFLCPG